MPRADRHPTDGRTTRGRVVDLDGRPIAGARVFTCTWAEGQQVVQHSTETGSDGAFELERDERPEARVWVEAPGFARDHFDLRARRMGHAGDFGVLRLAPGIRVRGRVVDCRGAQVGAAEVSVGSYFHVLAQTITQQGPPPSFEADDAGRFDVGPLGPGLHVLTVRAAGHADGEARVVVGAGETDRDVGEVALAPEARIAGIVVDEAGRPVAGARVTPGHHRDRSATTDDAGRFDILGQSEESGTLHVRAPGFRGASFRVEPPRDDRRLVVQPAFEIRGTAVDAETREPVEISELSLCRVLRKRDGTPGFFG